MQSKALKLEKYGISKARQYELEHFCLQYNEWKSEKNKISLLGSPDFEAIHVQGGAAASKTENLAMRLAEIDEKIQLVDTALVKAVDGDKGILEFLKKHVTTKTTYEYLGRMPCGRKKFYQYRRRFFIELDKTKK